MKKVVFLLLIAILLFTTFIFTKYSLNSEQVQQSPQTSFQLLSPVFLEKQFIPEKYSCNGENVNPRLIIQGPPEDTQSFVLIVDDLNTRPEKWIHWILFNIPPETQTIEENSFPANSINAKNSWGENKYGGPCPPFGTHNYVFRLYALDTKINLEQTTTREEIEEAMHNHILAETSLTGLYSSK